MVFAENFYAVHSRHEPACKKNICLIGVLGSGKTSVGWLLAKLLGFGFIDVDDIIEKKSKKSISEIFTEQGEEQFRAMEHDCISDLTVIRNHVISLGGGAVVDDDNWQRIKQLGTTIWLNTLPEEIARRIAMKPDELNRRPLLRQAINAENKEQRQKAISNIISSLIEQRSYRYKEADIVLEDSYSTPDISAHSVKSLLMDFNKTHH